MEEDKNYINLIRGDLTKASQAHNGMPDSVGMMNIKTANQTILEASLLPTPRALWDSFWYEGELSCLFADSNVGKSILAVQIADRIARTDNVLYLDFELSEKQFQLRYTNEHGELYTFPDKIYRVSIDCNQLLDANFEEAIIGGIEQMAVQTDCKIFIIDNLKKKTDSKQAIFYVICAAAIISNSTTVSASNEQTSVEDTGEQQPSLRQEIPKLKKGNWVNQTA